MNPINLFNGPANIPNALTSDALRLQMKVMAPWDQLYIIFIFFNLQSRDNMILIALGLLLRV